MARENGASECSRVDLSCSIRPNRAILKVFLLLFAVEILIVLLDVFGNYHRMIEPSVLRKIFAISHEKTLVTWMSSLLFFFAAVLLWIMSYPAKKTRSLWRVLDWKIFSLMYIYLSIDDVAKIHERVGTAFGNYAESFRWEQNQSVIAWIGNNFPSYYWQVVYVPTLGFMLLCLFILLWVECKDVWLRTLIVAAFGCYALSQGLDFVEGLNDGYRSVRHLLSMSTKEITHASKVIEEFLEMFGSTLIIVVLLKQFSQVCGRVEVKLKQNTVDVLSQ